MAAGVITNRVITTCIVVPGTLETMRCKLIEPPPDLIDLRCGNRAVRPESIGGVSQEIPQPYPAVIISEVALGSGFGGSFPA